MCMCVNNDREKGNNRSQSDFYSIYELRASSSGYQFETSPPGNRYGSTLDDKLTERSIDDRKDRERAENGSGDGKESAEMSDNATSFYMHDLHHTSSRASIGDRAQRAQRFS